MQRFLLADNQDVTRAGLRLYIEKSFPDAEIVDVADEAALKENLEKTPEAVVVLDYTTFDIKGLPAVTNTRQRFPRSRWVLFSAELTQNAIRLFATEEGVSIVMKDNSEDEIRCALRCASKGERFLCHQITNFLIEERTQRESGVKLTPTETDILKQIAKGKTVKEIAVERHSSVHTIISHKKNIFRKIEVNNVYEATKYALHAGLVDLMVYYI